MGTKLDKLNPRQRAFVVALVCGETAGNQAASYTAAGYSSKHPHTHASRLVADGNVAAAIEELRAEVTHKAEAGALLDAVERRRILAQIARESDDQRARIAALKLDAELSGELVKQHKHEHQEVSVDEAAAAMERARRKLAARGMSVVG